MGAFEPPFPLDVIVFEVLFEVYIGFGNGLGYLHIMRERQSSAKHKQKHRNRERAVASFHLFPISFSKG